MSTVAKCSLAASIVISASIIGYVHYKQRADRLQLHEGIIRDVERQQMKKIQNLQTLQKQIDLTKELSRKRELAGNSTFDS